MARARIGTAVAELLDGGCRTSEAIPGSVLGRPRRESPRDGEAP